MTDQPTPTPPESPCSDVEDRLDRAVDRLIELERTARFDASLRRSIVGTLRAWRDDLLTPHDAMVEVEAAMRDYTTNVGEVS